MTESASCKQILINMCSSMQQIILAICHLKFEWGVCITSCKFLVTFLFFCPSLCSEPSVYREAPEEEVLLVSEKKRRVSNQSKKDADQSVKKIPENVWGSSNQKVDADC